MSEAGQPRKVELRAPGAWRSARSRETLGAAGSRKQLDGFAGFLARSATAAASSSTSRVALSRFPIRINFKEVHHMATLKRFNKDKQIRSATPSRCCSSRKRFCRFTVAGVEEIDYKDIDTLRDFIGENGKIMPARLTGTRAHLPAPARHRASSAPASWRCCRTATSTSV